MTTAATLKFGYSPSRRYKKAVEIAASLPGYTQQGAGRSTVHQISVPLPLPEQVWELFDLVKEWVSSKVVIAGREMETKGNSWSLCDCYGRRLVARDKERFCYGRASNIYTNEQDNIWGCNLIARQWDNDSWKLVSEEVEHRQFKADPNEVEREIGHYERHSLILLCPAYDPERVRATLDDLPTREILSLEDYPDFFGSEDDVDFHSVIGRALFVAEQRVADDDDFKRIVDLLTPLFEDLSRCPRCGAGMLSDYTQLCLDCEGDNFLDDTEGSSLLDTVKSRLRSIKKNQ